MKVTRKHPKAFLNSDPVRLSWFSTAVAANLVYCILNP